MNIELAKANTDLAQRWFEERQDPETLKYNPIVPSTIESLRERLSKASSDLADYETSDTYFWAIKIADEVTGHVTMQNINRMMHTAEIGYHVSSNARGRGIATSAIIILVQNVFRQTPIRKLIAFVHEENHASRKVLEKAGFKQEGFLREHFIVNGKPANEIIYGILRSDAKKL